MRRALPEGFSLRRAREAELSVLVGLPAEADSYAVLDLCRAAGTLWTAVDARDAPQGFAAASELDGTLHLVSLRVASAHQGRGLGSALLDAVLDHGRWAFHPAVTVVTERDGAEGRFLLARGFLAMRSEALPIGLRAKVGAGPAGLVAMARRL